MRLIGGAVTGLSCQKARGMPSTGFGAGQNSPNSVLEVDL
jgi:hypothetical protein